MTEPRFPTRKQAKEAGWFSRRHETSEAHREATERYKAERSPEARRERAYERGAARPKASSVLRDVDGGEG